MKKTTSKFVSASLVSVMIVSLAGCGTIIYPERKGQSQGKIDVGIVALDALGLLVWFVPGVIAFAVDFATGAIYMPGGKTAQLTADEMDQVVSANGKVDQHKVYQLMSEKDPSLKQVEASQLKVKSLKSERELGAYFSDNEARPVLYSSL